MPRTGNRGPMRGRLENECMDIQLTVLDELGAPAPRHVVNQSALANWRQARFGLFIHWGIYSIPAGIWEGERIPKLGEQIQRHAAIPQQEYAKLAKRFNPIRFDAVAIARMAKDAGMRYIVITAKHHDGFCMFKSDYTDYNIVDATPFGRDVVGELAEACAAEGLRFGLYYSNPDWGYPRAVRREPANAYAVFEPFTPEHLEYSCKQLRELLTNYGPIVEVFFDMGLPTLEQSALLARTVHECQPNCLVSGRVMNNQGDFLTLPDNHMPDHPIEAAWETPCTFYHTWGYKSWIERPPRGEQIARQVKLLREVVGKGGNFLLNVGPLADGSILDYECDILAGIGEWLRTDGKRLLDAPHRTPVVPIAQPDPDGRVVLTPEHEHTVSCYNGLQYNTNIRDVEKTWTVNAPVPGRYRLDIDYRLTGGDMPVVLRAGDTELAIRLASRGGTETADVGLADGNETPESENRNAGTCRRTYAGTIEIPTPGQVKISLVKDASQIRDDGVWTEADLDNPNKGAWCLNETWTANRRTNAKHSMKGLQILRLELRRCAAAATRARAVSSPK